MSVTDQNQQSTQTVNLKRLIASPEAIAHLSESNARRLLVIPLAMVGDTASCTLIVAAETATDAAQQERLRRHLGFQFNIQIVVASREQIAAAIDKCYRHIHSLDALLKDSCVDQLQSDTELPRDYHVHLLEALLREAWRRRASDIHLSPIHEGLLVRFRIDGVLETIATLHECVINSLVVRIKVLASLDIAETRLPQDGQFDQVIDAAAVEFRVSMFPTVAGENAVLRVIGNSQHATLESLSLPNEMLVTLRNLLDRPDGLIIVCGPTGAGKSTTLFALLAEKDQQSLNIMTLEDPVEQRLPGIRQSNIDPARSFDYPQGLKAMLRQDPDVLLIGEIRDSQSCEMALRAVTSGHQVLTTIHAGSAHAAVTRLREFDAQSHILSSCLSAIISQRLLRKSCPACKTGDSQCELCNGTGCHGRQAILEVLLIDKDISHLLAIEADVKDIEAVSNASGFTSLQQHAQRYVEAGTVTPQEIVRVLGRAQS
jgi:general secretion pathway protein E/type IV pilus assembly protein PilB